MRMKNPELEQDIRAKTLGLLMVKEPEEIGMREIAAVCGVTATTIYYYYENKESLFEDVKKDCMSEMDRFIFDRVSSVSDSSGRWTAAFAAFRDWAFGNPRIALLVMNRFKPNVDAGPEEMDQYYQSTYFARDLIKSLVDEGKAHSADALLDATLCIAAVWGAIESVLRFRTVPEYWDRGVELTDRMIEMCGARIALSGGIK